MVNNNVLKIHKSQQGFNLIELMIVVAVIVVLASIAIPSYGDYVRRGRIAEATSTLSDARVRLEQFFLDNRTYVGFANCPTATTFFQYSCSPLTAAAYTLTATGQNTMANFSYSLNEANTKASSTIWTSGVQNCWIRSKGSAC
jgi:type IV pilus assembly protein PilE